MSKIYCQIVERCEECPAFKLGVAHDLCENTVLKCGRLRYLPFSHYKGKFPKWCPLKEARDE